MNSKEALAKLYMACDNELLYEQSGIIFINELITIIEKDLYRVEKLEKVIDIIKNKNVNLSELYHLFKWNETTPTEYNEGLGKDYKLTQEEYDLLKEYLK